MIFWCFGPLINDRHSILWSFGALDNWSMMVMFITFALLLNFIFLSFYFEFCYMPRVKPRILWKRHHFFSPFSSLISTRQHACEHSLFIKRRRSALLQFISAGQHVVSSALLQFILKINQNIKILCLGQTLITEACSWDRNRNRNKQKQSGVHTHKKKIFQ